MKKSRYTYDRVIRTLRDVRLEAGFKQAEVGGRRCPFWICQTVNDDVRSGLLREFRPTTATYFPFGDTRTR